MNLSPRLALAGFLLLGLSAPLSAQFLENYSATPNLTVPDADVVGVASTINVSGSSILDITSVQVSLSLSGGFNGDYFAYLVHTLPGGGAGGFVTLLNRTGVTGSDPVGYGDAGFNVTFASAGNDIHLYQAFTNPGGAPLTGTWAPDGRSASPFSVTDLSPRDTSLTSFNGTSANGTWTLFVADVAGGDQGQFVSWSLQIVGVPEPATGVVGAVALALGVLTGWRRERIRRTTRPSASPRDK